MKKLTNSELDNILEQHMTWLDAGHRHLEGTLANLQGVDLQGLDLQDAKLRAAHIQDADLQGANLQDADLRYASLQAANLRGANCQDAFLQGADLRGANLQGTCLMGANLHFADLRDAEIDINIRDCYSFGGAKFTPDALPWLILHPQWAQIKYSVQIMDTEEGRKTHERERRQ